MVGPIERRRASPALVQQLWAAVNAIRGQKQIPNQERIVRYVIRNQELAKPTSSTAASGVPRIMSAEDIAQQLEWAVQDELISAYTTVGTKGSKLGTEQEGYRVPDSKDEDESGTSGGAMMDEVVRKKGDVFCVI